MVVVVFGGMTTAGVVVCCSSLLVPCCVARTKQRSKNYLRISRPRTFMVVVEMINSNSPSRRLVALRLMVVVSRSFNSILRENPSVSTCNRCIATPHRLFPDNRRRLDCSESIKQACRDGSIASNTFLSISKRISTLREQELYHCTAGCIAVRMVCYMLATVKK